MTEGPEWYQDEGDLVARLRRGDLERSRFPVIPGYQIIREIHRGGQGVVYEAVQAAPERHVALKMMLGGPFASERARHRFEREVELAGNLKHPNIVAIHHSGKTDGCYWFAMDYVEGHRLDQYLLQESLPVEAKLRLFSKISDAVRYAHQHGVIHRDLKPSNILIEKGGEPRVLDLGLARLVDPEAGTQISLDGQVLGTLPYMSPEQASGRANDVDVRTDVYALGVILYEMLTGAYPYDVTGNMQEVLHRIQNVEPLRPSEVGKTKVDAGTRNWLTRMLPRYRPGVFRSSTKPVDKELETIVLRAISKEQARRYQAVDDLSRDIGHYLNREPIEAGPDSWLYTSRKWVLRNKVKSASAALILVSLAAFALVVTAKSRTQARLLVERDVQAKAARRENLIQRLRIVCEAPFRQGWSEHAWKLAREITEIAPEDVARNQAAAALVDLDAHAVAIPPTLEGIGASALAFDCKEELLLLGGLDAADGFGKQDAKLLRLGAGPRSDSTLEGCGPVAFRPDGTPLQLVASEKTDALILWDVTKRTSVCELPFPEQVAAVRAGERRVRAMALTTDGSLAAAAKLQDGKSAVVLWECATGKLLRHLTAEANVLAFSPDGALLAAGDTDGKIMVWSLTQEEPIARLQEAHTRVNCLAFGRDPVWSTNRDGGTGGAAWLLAAGHRGGSIIVWDLAKRLPRAYCSGLQNDVYALDLSPDGALLAGGGHDAVKLWDVATGRLILVLASGDFTSAIRFSPDGTTLAAATQGARPRRPRQLCLWKLENGRGIRVLRGLRAPLSKLCLSRDGQLVAALSHDWRVAIWRVKDKVSLARILDAPQGEYPDNVALAFSPDDQQLAFSTWDKACLWEVDSGLVLREWPLPKGLDDLLTFAPDGELLSFRVETQAGTEAPDGGAPPAKYPRVCRIRKLLREQSEPSLVKEIEDFNRYVACAVTPRDGKYFVIDGLGGPDGTQRMVKIFDSAGRELGSLPSPKPWRDPPIMACDPTGQFLTVFTENKGHATLFEMPAFKPLGTLGDARAVSPGAKYWAGLEQYYATSDPFSAGETKIVLHAVGSDGSPRVALGTCSGEPSRFSDDGGFLAWGGGNTVYLCDLSEVRRRLAQLGLDWRD